MRGSLMRRWTPEQHQVILTNNPDNGDAAREYAKQSGKPISRQNVKYWRNIFLVNDGNMAATDRLLKGTRKFIKPEPDDDIGNVDFVPDVAHSIMVIPDIHAPYEHPDTLPFLIAVRNAFKPDLCVQLGDELDYHALSFHDSDPNLDSAGTELEKSKKFMRRFHKEFPQLLICHSNHGSMVFRKAKAHGVPVQALKSYREVLFPTHKAKDWSWRYAWRVETPLGTVLFKHQASGPAVNDAAHNQASLVVGHEHGKFGIDWAASSAHIYFGMYSGCLIDKDALAFAYGKHSLKKPIIGCSVILEGRPMLIPMILNDDGRWVGQL